MLTIIFSVNTAAALDGSGTEADPWRIQSLADFNDFAADANYWNDYTRLETDVNLAGQTYSTAVIAPDVNNSNYFFDGNAFTGVFDGNDHRILNLTIDGGASNDYVGLFGYIDGSGSTAQIKSLCLENITITGGDASYFFGCLCGENDGTISNCYATGWVTGNSLLGGLCGGNSGTISNCYATGSVTGGYLSSSLGGLCGDNWEGTISNCHATGSVTVGDDSWDLGGLCGSNSGTISNCYATGSVTDGYEACGGLCGSNYLSGTISNCYATGSVTGGGYLGGLCGVNGSTISNCYSTGSVTGAWEPCGGLCAENDGTISNSFWNTETSGQHQSAGGTGLGTESMAKIISFTNAGWDFTNESTNGTDDIWRMCVDDVHFPHLSFQYSVSSDFTCPDGVNLLDFSILAQSWRSIPAYDNWDSDCDLDGDEHIGAGDLAITSNHWLEGVE